MFTVFRGKLNSLAFVYIEFRIKNCIILIQTLSQENNSCLFNLQCYYIHKPICFWYICGTNLPLF